MRDAIAPRIGQICRYTAPDGNHYDAIVQEIEGAQAFIQYRPAGVLVSVSCWVNYFTLSVPR